jgi:hypothetical protein
MDNAMKEIIWQQFGAAVDMLENAVLACPDNLWVDRSQRPEFWYVRFGCGICSSCSIYFGRNG